MDNYFNFQKTTNNSFNLDVDNLVVNEAEDILGTANFYQDVSLLNTADLKIQDITITAPAGNPHYTLTLPPNTGTNGYVLTTNGAGVLSWNTPLPGSGLSVTVPSFMSVAVTNPTTAPTIAITAASTGTVASGSPNGVVVLQNSPTIYTPNITTYFKVDNITIQSPVGAPTYALTLPPNDGASGQVLTTDGTGVLSWTTTVTDISVSVPAYMSVTVTNPTSTPSIAITGAYTGTVTAGTPNGVVVLQDTPTINTLYVSGATQGYIKTPSAKNGLEIETEGSSKFIKLTTNTIKAGNSTLQYYDQLSDTTNAFSAKLGQQHGQTNSPQSITFGLVYQYLFIADTNNHRITYINDFGKYQLGAGTGVAGFVDGSYNTARFNGPTGMTIYDFNIGVDPEPDIYICDTNNHAIRKLKQAIVGTGTAARPAEGIVSTIAGTGSPGYVDGLGSTAQFNYPRGVTLRDNSAIYVADTNNHCIRLIEILGATITVSTIAGTNSPGYVDNCNGVDARFNFPEALYYDDIENVLYVCDTGNQVIRVIDVSNTNYPVNLLAGDPGVASYFEVVNATMQYNSKFNRPTGVVSKGKTIFIAEPGNYIIRKIVATGDVKAPITQGTTSRIAGFLAPGDSTGPSLSAEFNNPLSVTRNNDSSLIYISDTNNNRIKALGLVKATLGTPAYVWNIFGTGIAGNSFGNQVGSHYLTGKQSSANVSDFDPYIKQIANNLNDVDITTFLEVTGNVPQPYNFRPTVGGNIFVRTGGNDWYYNKDTGIPVPVSKIETTRTIPNTVGSIYIESVQATKMTSIYETTIFSYEKVFVNAPNVEMVAYNALGNARVSAPFGTAELQGVTCAVNGTAVTTVNGNAGVNVSSAGLVLIASALGDIKLNTTSALFPTSNIFIDCFSTGPGNARLTSGASGSTEIRGGVKLQLSGGLLPPLGEVEMSAWNIDISAQNNIDLYSVLGSAYLRSAAAGAETVVRGPKVVLETFSAGDILIESDQDVYILTGPASGNVYINSTVGDINLSTTQGDIISTAFIDPTFTNSKDIILQAGGEIRLSTFDPDQNAVVSRKLSVLDTSHSSGNIQSPGFSVGKNNPSITLLTAGTVYQSGVSWFGRVNIDALNITTSMGTVFIEDAPNATVPGTILFPYALYIKRGNTLVKGDLELYGNDLASATLNSDGLGGRLFVTGFRRGIVNDGTCIRSGGIIHIDTNPLPTTLDYNSHYFAADNLQSINPLSVTNRAVNVYIDGPPYGTLTKTIVNAYSLYINSGQSYFKGQTTFELPAANNVIVKNDIGTLGVNINPSGDVFINSPQNPTTLITSAVSLSAGSLVSLGGASILKDLYVGGTIVGYHRYPTLSVTKDNTTTYVMTSTSPQQIIFSGTQTQDVYLPNLLTVTDGSSFILNVVGTGIVTVYTYLGIVELSKIYANQQVVFTAGSASEWTYTDNVENNNIGDAVGRSLSLDNTYTTTTGFIKVENTALTTNVNMFTAKATNLTATGTSYIQVGREATTNNMGRLQFVYDALGSTNNYVSVGVIGQEALKLYNNFIEAETRKKLR